MATYLSNRNSDGKTDENGHFRLPLKLIDGEILEGLTVSANSTPDMTIKISAGEAKIPYQDYAYAVWSDSVSSLTISTASSSNPRIDRIIGYVDRNETFSSTDVNNPGAFKFKVVAGTPASVPAPASDATVQSSVGAGNPWIELGRVTGPMNTTGITSANIDSSMRVPISLSPNVKTPEITTVDGSAIKFMVINEGESLPSAIPDTTLVVLVAKN